MGVLLSISRAGLPGNSAWQSSTAPVLSPESTGAGASEKVKPPTEVPVSPSLVPDVPTGVRSAPAAPP